jgi:hypothetical protein
MGMTCLLKRGMIYYENDKLEQALKDLDECSQQQDESILSTVNYLKGMIYYRKNKLIESMLCF